MGRSPKVQEVPSSLSSCWMGEDMPHAQQFQTEGHNNYLHGFPVYLLTNYWEIYIHIIVHIVISISNSLQPSVSFRWDYYDQHKRDLDGFEEFLSDGVRAKWVEPVFPTSSYPNWHTISTGLFPQHHGIIGTIYFY